MRTTFFDNEIRDFRDILCAQHFMRLKYVLLKGKVCFVVDRTALLIHYITPLYLLHNVYLVFTINMLNTDSHRTDIDYRNIACENLSVTEFRTAALLKSMFMASNLYSWRSVIRTLVGIEIIECSSYRAVYKKLIRRELSTCSR